MSRRTLPDELRSVLLSHSLDAPDPDDTVEAILAGTVAGPVREPAHRRRWRSSPSLVGVAASVVLLVAGAAVVRAMNHGSSDNARSSSVAAASRAASNASSGPGHLNGPKAAQGSQAQGPQTPGDLALTPPGPADLNCLPGGKLVNGARTVFPSAGGSVYVFEFYCLAVDGKRGGSQIEDFRRVDDKLLYLSTLIEAKKDLHLLEMVGDVNGVTLTGTSGAGSPSGDLVSLRMTTKDGGLTFADVAHVIASACQAKDLSVKVASVERSSAADGQVLPSHFVLQVTNHTAAPCALEGYPALAGARDGKVVGPMLLPVLRGPAGGVFKAQVAPIIELAPGSTAGAIIETAAILPTCVPTPQLSVTLANGVALGPVPATLFGCSEQVHPFVDNPLGNG